MVTQPIPLTNASSMEPMQYTKDSPPLCMNTHLPYLAQGIGPIV